MRMKKLLSLLLALVMVLSLVPATVFATSANNVYISVSYDGQYINDKNGGYIAYVAVPMETVAAINLDDYGLSDYWYDEDGDGNYETTALQLVIYAHENIYGGSWSDVNFTGAAGSSYFQGGIFGFDENLNYYLNGQYPLAGAGWGATSDQIVLEAGDFIDLASFSSWDFYQDSAYGFHFFADGNGEITHAYTAEAGVSCDVKLIKGTKDYEYNSVFYDVPDYEVFYGTAYGDVAGSVTTDGNGCASITFPTAGIYYLWVDGGYGNEYSDAIVSAPGYATVTVTGESTGGNPGDGSGTGDGEGSEDKPAETDTDTAVVVTADSGIALSAKASFCDDCYETVYAENQVTGIDTVIDWQCSGHGTTPNTYIYSFSVNAFPKEGYSITGVTINGTKYTVNSTDDTYDTIYIDEYSYIAENYNCVSTSILSPENIAPGDMEIHIHAQKDAEESPEQPRQPQDVSAVLNATMAQLAATVPAPAFGTDAGEWTVLSLARGGYYTKDNKYFTDYYDRIVETVNTTAASVNMSGALHKNKSTENSRLIVALSALGKDATAVGNWNLVEAYSANGFSWIKKQGLNGTIWALIALDSNNYATTDATIRQQCVDSILSLQHDDGGWALQANLTYASDPDVTGMALTALYPYRDQPAVAAAAEEAFACLSAMQHDNGTFASGGSECSESCAWVIVSTTTWGINPDTDSRFIKNGNSVVDALLTHYLADSATFQHIIGAGSNAMATDQATYALVAYDRFINGEKALFDYSDVAFETPSVTEGAPKVSLGLPEEVANDVGTIFNVNVSIDQWDSTAGYKLLDMVMTVPAGLKVNSITATRLDGGSMNFHLDEEDTLRLVYFDEQGNEGITIVNNASGNTFPAEMFTIEFEVTELLDEGALLEITIDGMSLKTSSDSYADDSQLTLDTYDAAGKIKVVAGISYSAKCLYTGDGIDLIPTDKKAVAVAVAGIKEENSTPKLSFKNGDTEILFLYSEEMHEKTGIHTYVALVDVSIAMEEFAEEENFKLNKKADSATITFGDSNGDTEINAQDALNAVNFWLRKYEPADNHILAANVNSDSRLNTYDALGIVEHFVNGSEFAVVTMALSLKPTETSQQ